MRTRVHDPVGPAWVRAIVPILGSLVIAGDYALVRDVDALGPAAFVGFCLVVLASPLLGRHAPRPARIDLADGAIRIRAAGLLDQTIRARDVLGASTTSDGDKVTLALARSGRPDHPILLELASKDDADDVRRALDVGHFGVGALAFHVKTTLTQWLLLAGRIAVAFLALTFAVGRITAPWSPAGSAVSLLATLTVVLAFASRRRGALEGRLLLDGDGVHYGRQGRRRTFAFEALTQAEPAPHALLLHRVAGPPLEVPIDRVRHRREGMSEAELAHVALQVTSAARRAHGELAAPPNFAALSELARRDARPETWIGRLDAAAHLLDASSHYRGASVTEADLWSALESPDAPADLRAAAARVLAIARPQDRARIESVAERVREKPVETRIRIMLEPDAGLVTEKLAEIEDADLTGPRRAQA